MSNAAAAKMSIEASDFQTDEDCEELVEDGFSFSADVPLKTPRRKSKPPLSPKSPYLSSLNVNPRRAAVAAWRLPRASLGDTRGDTLRESASAHLTSLSNGHDLSQTMRSECDVTPDFIKQTLTARKHKRSASNGFTTPTDYRRKEEKEDMYDEIIRLKKCLQEQKTDNHQMKAKLRRLEEDNAKREKQIEELLDPTKGPEYTRSLVDKKKEGSVVLNGLKHRILKLEQQCREKENALSKLESELRTTNLEELKITVESYFEEIQRLRMLLEVAEKSSRAESKCSQRQQKALSSTVVRLSDNMKQLQQENTALREELNIDSPAGGIKGYREWSRQRLLRRLLEVEKRLTDSRRHAQSAKSSTRLDQEVQATPPESLHVTQGVARVTAAVVSVGMMTEGQEEVFTLRGRLNQLEEEKAGLQEMLSSKDNELRQLRTEREELEKETERWKREQTHERDKEREANKLELDQLRSRIQTLEEERTKPAQVGLSSPPLATPERQEDTEVTQRDAEGTETHEDTEAIQRDAEGTETHEEAKEEELGDEACGSDSKRKSKKNLKKDREKAARTIQTSWRDHRNRDIVMVQSALRAHRLRETLLQEDTQDKAVVAKNCSDVASFVDGEPDVVALTMIQSAFRGHLSRSAVESSGISVRSTLGNIPTPAPRRAPATSTPSKSPALLHSDGGKDPWSGSATHPSRVKPTSAQMEPGSTAECGAAAVHSDASDDSDDIIVSPSHPLRSREGLIL
ncbi:IQ domain-containing protein E [Genypterus blacodes]|uniref:IQ domain-containing protein E n=1 Tax=Genypterus blacodes TaxID=154954 RepID=UPI003F77296D